MKVFVGLGNPGSRYDQTRHNVGFWVIDRLAQRLAISVNRHKFKSKIGEGFAHGEKILLVKPQTFMNLSGEAVAAVLGYHQVDLEDLLVIYDDLALEPGRIRLRGQGSHGGHNGMKNIILHLNSNAFARLRLGIGQNPPLMETADYVLSRPAGEDMKLLAKATDLAADAGEAWLKNGLEPTMNEYNRKS